MQSGKQINPKNPVSNLPKPTTLAGNNSPSPQASSINNLTQTPSVSPHIDTLKIDSVPATSVTIDHGHGAIRGIEDLQKSLNKQYPNITKAPQNIQDFVHTDATKEAIKLGLYNPNTTEESAKIITGSTLGFDEHGNLILHEAIANKDAILIHGDTAQVDQYHDAMFHSEHHDIPHITQTETNTYPPETPANRDAIAALHKADTERLSAHNTAPSVFCF